MTYVWILHDGGVPIKYVANTNPLRWTDSPREAKHWRLALDAVVARQLVGHHLYMSKRQVPAGGDGRAN